MICDECGLHRPLTYRSAALGVKSVCAWCIRQNHPETLLTPDQQEEAEGDPRAKVKVE